MSGPSKYNQKIPFTPDRERGVTPLGRWSGRGHRRSTVLGRRMAFDHAESLTSSHANGEPAAEIR